MLSVRTNRAHISIFVLCSLTYSSRNQMVAYACMRMSLLVGFLSFLFHFDSYGLFSWCERLTRNFHFWFYSNGLGYKYYHHSSGSVFLRLLALSLNRQHKTDIRKNVPGPIVNIYEAVLLSHSICYKIIQKPISKWFDIFHWVFSSVITITVNGRFHEYSKIEQLMLCHLCASVQLDYYRIHRHRLRIFIG